jgi:hypothetical protein
MPTSLPKIAQLWRQSWFSNSIQLFAMRTQNILLAFLVSLATVSPSLSAAASEATKGVIKAIEARDCVEAVRQLNLALSGGSPEALLLGGAMFEQGLCLKQNTERASRLYVRAVDAGAGGARSRLAALYASPVGGLDKGVAIWWGLQANLPLPKPCVVSSDLRGNAELFAQTISNWPAGVLDACVHVTGVLATLDAEFVVKPQVQARDSLSVDFHPADGRLEVSANPTSLALIDNSPRVVTTNNVVGVNNAQQSATTDQMRALLAQEERAQLAKRVESISRDAITRFPRPAGMDSSWRIQLSIESARDR